VTTATMSRPAAARPASPSSAPVPRPRPRLTVADAPTTAISTLPFAILVAGILASGLVALLLLHTMAAQDAFRVHSLQQQAETLADEQQQLQLAVAADQSPASLAAAAQRLGMRATSISSYHKLHDGRTVGVEAPVALPVPQPSTTTKPKAAKSKAAKPSSAAGKHTSGGAPATATARHAAAGQQTTKTGTHADRKHR